MKQFTLAALVAATALVGGCKIVIDVPEGGTVTTESGDFSCAAGTRCVVDVSDTSFDQTYVAEPAQGYAFNGWKRKSRSFCARTEGPCRLATTAFVGIPELLQILDTDEEFYLEPQFVPFNQSGVSGLLQTNADIAYAAYSDAVDTAIALKKAIDALAANPTQANLDAAKRAWLVAREPYGQTEVYRFRLSPIDSTNYRDEDGLEGEINAWPLGEALIDYVVAADPDFGADQVGVIESSTPVNGGGPVDGTTPSLNIIADTSITINNTLVARTATAEDEHDVIAGYHAIEFLLWGQDLNNNAMVTDGTDRDEAVKTYGAGNLAVGGQRPLSDFTSDPLAERRLRYLDVVARKLVRDLQSVRDGWADGVSGNYRDQFTSYADSAEAIEKITEILVGMGTLSEGELAGERMQIAYSSNSQEDEHSCFSDNTHRDVVLNALGVANSFYGAYAGYDSDLDGVVDQTTRAVDGFGFDDYAEQIGNAALSEAAAALASRLTATQVNYNELDAAARNGMPFDVLIMDENRSKENPIYKTIIALNQQSTAIAALAEVFAIEGEKVVDDEASECDTTDPDSSC